MTLTIQCPTDNSKTYTYGKRGRKPLWVQEWEKQNPDKVPEKKVVVTTKEPTADSEFYQWSLTNSIGCIVVAKNELDALLHLNRTFDFPVTGSELKSLWTKTPADTDNFTEGVWQMTDNGWAERKAA